MDRSIIQIENSRNGGGMMIRIDIPNGNHSKPCFIKDSYVSKDSSAHRDYLYELYRCKYIDNNAIRDGSSSRVRRTRNVNSKSIDDIREEELRFNRRKFLAKRYEKSVVPDLQTRQYPIDHALDVDYAQARESKLDNLPVVAQKRKLNTKRKTRNNPYIHNNGHYIDSENLYERNKTVELPKLERRKKTHDEITNYDDLHSGRNKNDLASINLSAVKNQKKPTDFKVEDKNTSIQIYEYLNNDKESKSVERPLRKNKNKLLQGYVEYNNAVPKMTQVSPDFLGEKVLKTLVIQSENMGSAKGSVIASRIGEQFSGIRKTRETTSKKKTKLLQEFGDFISAIDSSNHQISFFSQQKASLEIIKFQNESEITKNPIVIECKTMTSDICYSQYKYENDSGNSFLRSSQDTVKIFPIRKPEKNDGADHENGENFTDHENEETTVENFGETINEVSKYEELNNRPYITIDIVERNDQEKITNLQNSKLQPELKALDLMIIEPETTEYCTVEFCSYENPKYLHKNDSVIKVPPSEVIDNQVENDPNENKKDHDIDVDLTRLKIAAGISLMNNISLKIPDRFSRKKSSQNSGQAEENNTPISPQLSKKPSQIESLKDENQDKLKSEVGNKDTDSSNLGPSQKKHKNSILKPKKKDSIMNEESGEKSSKLRDNLLVTDQKRSSRNLSITQENKMTIAKGGKLKLMSIRLKKKIIEKKGDSLARSSVRSGRFSRNKNAFGSNNSGENENGLPVDPTFNKNEFQQFTSLANGSHSDKIEPISRQSPQDLTPSESQRSSLYKMEYVEMKEVPGLDPGKADPEYLDQLKKEQQVLEGYIRRGQLDQKEMMNLHHLTKRKSRFTDANDPINKIKSVRIGKGPYDLNFQTFEEEDGGEFKHLVIGFEDEVVYWEVDTQKKLVKMGPEEIVKIDTLTKNEDGIHKEDNSEISEKDHSDHGIDYEDSESSEDEEEAKSSFNTLSNTNLKTDEDLTKEYYISKLLVYEQNGLLSGFRCYYTKGQELFKGKLIGLVGDYCSEVNITPNDKVEGIQCEISNFKIKNLKFSTSKGWIFSMGNNKFDYFGRIYSYAIRRKFLSYITAGFNESGDLTCLSFRLV